MKIVTSTKLALYRAEHWLRTKLGLKPRWQWEVCLGCGPFIRCPACSGNCGFQGDNPDGSPCQTCIGVIAAWRKAREDGTAPSTGKFSRDAILRARGKRHDELVAMGVKFGTVEDILSIVRDVPPIDDGDVIQNDDGSITTKPKET